MLYINCDNIRKLHPWQKNGAAIFKLYLSNEKEKKLKLEFLRFHYLALRCFGFVAFIYSATVREIKLLLVKQIKYRIMCQFFLSILIIILSKLRWIAITNWPYILNFFFFYKKENNKGNMIMAIYELIWDCS